MLRILLFVALSLAVLASVSCEDETTNSGVELVTVAGIVRNADTGVPIAGVRTRLVGTKYQDEVPTGTDGAFELEVPKGSTLWLVTDDFNASQDLLFPMINGDIPPVVANDDVLDLAIHACPNTIGDGWGSIAVIDNYLKTQDDANGDIFEATGAVEAGGIVCIFFSGCEGGQVVPDGYTFSVTSSEPACPVSYFNSACIAANGWVTTCDSIMYPPTQSVTGGKDGMALIVCAPDFRGGSVICSFDDTTSTRNLSWPTTKIPVQHGGLTLVWPAWIDGRTGVTFGEFGRACGWFTAVLPAGW